MNILNVHPFRDLSDEGKILLADNLEYKYYSIGERIYRDDEIPYEINLIVKGEVRVLAKSTNENSLITVERKGAGALIGWVGLLRGKSCETIQVSKDVESISISSEAFVRLCLTEKDFVEYFDKKTDVSETWDVLSTYFEQYPYENRELDSVLRNACKTCEIASINDTKRSDTNDYILSTDNCNLPIGHLISSTSNIETKKGFVFKARTNFHSG